MAPRRRLSRAGGLLLSCGLLLACGPVVVLRRDEHGRRVEVREDRGAQQLYLDGVPAGLRWAAIGEVVSSAAGRHVAYAAQGAAGWVVVRDGQVGAPCAGVLAGTLRFSPDGQHLVYAAQVSAPRAGVVVDVDRVRSAVYDGVAGLTYSADGARLGYLARRGDEVRAVVDGAEGPAYEAIAELVLGRQRVGLIARRGGRWRVVLDGEEGAAVDSAAWLRLSPDGRHAVYAAQERGAWSVVKDGVAAGRWDRVLEIVWAPAGDGWGYVARRGDEHVVVLGGDAARGRGYAWAGGLCFSLDGRRHAYLARRGEQALVVHDRGAAAFGLLVEGTLVFGRGGRWGVLAGDPERRRLYIAIEGVGGQPFKLERFLAAFSTHEIKAEVARALVREALGVAPGGRSW